MAKTWRNRKPEGAATPPLKSISKKQTEPFDSDPHYAEATRGRQGGSLSSNRVNEKGFLSMAEVAVGTLVIALLLVVAVSTLRVTEKGTIKLKESQQAMDLAKGKSEELKSYLSSQSWNNMNVDVRFPPTQTPVVGSYNAYSPTTVTLGKNQYILDPEVRYVYQDSSNLIQYVPTPAAVGTPEVGNLVRIRMDCYYGPLSEFIPLPTAEAVSNTANRVVYTNFIANKQIYVGATGSISGYVYIGCNTSTPSGQGIVVGLFQGAQEVSSVITNSSSYFEFDNVQQGIYYLETVSSPGYQPVVNYSCGVPEPVTLTGGTNLSLQNLGIQAIPVINYYGVVVQTTPVVDTVFPTSPTPTPNPTAVAGATPVTGAIVFADDGNSSPTSSVAGGAYTITQVRATPNAGHNDDTIEGDNLSPSTPTPVYGKNYNHIGSNMYGPLQVLSPGQTYIGPITIYLQNPVTTNQSVTFTVLDADTIGAFPNNFYPVTVSAADGSVSPPSKATTVAGQLSVFMNVHQGLPAVSVTLSNNTNPAPSYITFNQAVSIGASVTAPVTLTNEAVGSCAGTVCGMGASFDYTQFTVHAVDAFSGQYSYDIPVVYDGGSTYGTFSYADLRTPEFPIGNGNAPNAQLDYNFSANSSGNFSSSQVLLTVKQGQVNKLADPIVVSALNVYMAVTVTYNNNTPYPYGAWISAIMVPSGQTPQPVPTAGQGSGFGVSDYFSGLTTGSGTANLEVQLAAAQATTYVVNAQIVDPNTYALSNKAQTILVQTNSTQASPAGVSFGF